MSHTGPAGRLGGVLLAIGLCIAGACASTAPSEDPVSAPDQPGPDEACPAPVGDLAGFGASVIAVVTAAGERLERCVLVARSPDLRAQGLMEVTALGPYAGMIFAYAEPSTGGYWMHNTPMPLSIVWIGDDGQVLARADMDPCRDQSSGCPSYSPGVPYRWAVEVEQGSLGRFGLADGGRLDPESLPVGID